MKEWSANTAQKKSIRADQARRRVGRDAPRPSALHSGGSGWAGLEGPGWSDRPMRGRLRGLPFSSPANLVSASPADAALPAGRRIAFASAPRHRGNAKDYTSSFGNNITLN